VSNLQNIINNKTKPIGALGYLENIAMQIGNIQDSTEPSISNPHIIVFAADHGIAATGLVNPYPQAVTAQMVLNFLQGGAAINVFTKQHNTALLVVDCGVNFNFDKNLYNSFFINKKVAFGTANYLEVPALSKEQAMQCIQNGKDLINNLSNTCNTVGFGEMGIGNTAASSLIMHAITKIDLNNCIGKGTGASDEQLVIKQNTLAAVANLHKIAVENYTALDILQKVGGFEIATMVGAYLQAANNNMVIIVDGFIATAALLIANAMQPSVINNCVFAHTSGENGHTAMLSFLKATPLLQLGMRLGEGTGAALAIPLLQSATLFVKEMASFDSANVSTATIV
jgi:nicotinate-nucleotide--dimethylbenzimidazole phosphoribosyltransferase